MNVRMLALVGMAGLGAGACVDNNADSGLRIIGNVSPGDGCVVDSASTTFQDDGRIEASSVIGYVFTPSVINDLVTVGDEPIGPKTIYVTHAKVTIDFYDPALEGTGGDASLVDFRVPVSGSIEPNGGTAGFSFEVVPPELLAAIGEVLPAPNGTLLPRTTLDVRVQIVGTRGGGGGTVMSNVFRYPVEVCNGCVLVDRGACTALPADFMASTGGVCNTLQDGVLDCCDNFTVCPAVAPEPML